MKTNKPRTLSCGCCGKAFTGLQWWNHDTGYGKCKECCEWILSTPRWHYDHADVRKCMTAQWPGVKNDNHC